ncbi:MAG: hypothetical protein V4530_01395 [Pseudomonadota bacterium]
MIINNIAFYGAARLASGLLLYLTFVAALYGLDKQQYQYFSVSYPLYQILTVTCFGWIAAIIPSLVAGAQDEAQRRAESTLRSSYLSMCAVALIVLLVMYITGGIDVPWLTLIALAAMTTASGASDSILALANAHGQHRHYLSISLARYGTTFVLVIILVLFRANAGGILAAIGAGAALSVGVWWKTRNRLAERTQLATISEVVSLLRIGLPAMLAFAIYQLSMSISRLIIAQGCSPSAATALGGVNDFLSGPILLVFQVINLALNPRLYGAANRGDQPALRRAAIMIIVIQLAIIAPSTILLFTVGRLIGDALLANKLGASASQILPYVGLATLFSLVFNTSIGVALARKKATIMAVFGICIVGATAALAVNRKCDILGFAQGFSALMAISGLCGLALIYLLTRPTANS